MNDYSHKDIIDALRKLVENNTPYAIETLISDTSDSKRDVLLRPAHLEVFSNESWVIVDKETWRSWTGLRRVFGIEYHGAVYNYLTPEGSPPFTGKRICKCSTCQEHVAAPMKDN